MINEHLRGTGNLWLNGKLIRRGLRYDVRKEQHGVMGRITGRIHVDPLGDGMTLMTMEGNGEPNSDLVLELEDGRRWHCVLKNNQGELLNRDGFEDPQKGR